jgi:DNA polymerase-3 subunit beta
MKNEIKTKDLLAALKACKKLVTKRNTMPILSNVAFLVRNNALHIQATDIDNTLTVALCDTEQPPGAYLVDAGQLYDYITASDDPFVKFSYEPGKLAIKTDGMTKTAPDQTTDWPIVDKQPDEFYPVNVDNLAAVALATSTDPTRYHLNGVYFDAKEARIVATDGHRLHADACNGLKDSFILPSVAVNVVQHVGGAIELSRIIEDKYICVRLGAGVLTTRIDIGKFPNWRQFVPQQHKTTVEAKTDALVKALKKAAKLANKKTRTVIFDGKRLECGDDVTVFLEGVQNETRFGVNCDYMLEAVESVEADELTINLNDARDPIFFNANSFTAVVMPMRI